MEIGKFNPLQMYGIKFKYVLKKINNLSLSLKNCTNDLLFCLL